ncbi:hypothetical protein GCM10027275_49970 [Rhabdobacter roseus]|jgi:hypothetical protein|uniref:DUF4843 domain-containing protein n=1 Tax=Rhabdobacter roseus TaxID=1655419 RepID=A0A840U4P2_9BACT|nr:hypothetical protein [Rhabdobacter roseus]
MKKLSVIAAASFLILNFTSCQEKNIDPDFPPTKAYYAFRVFNPTNPSQPRNEVGFDTLTYRAEDGNTHILTNRSIFFTNDYDTTIYVNVPADRILEGYLSSSKAQSVSIEIGLIDKSGGKRKLDYKLEGIGNQVLGSKAVVRVRLRKEVSLENL